jgi:hypothetical protein
VGVTGATPNGDYEQLVANSLHLIPKPSKQAKIRVSIAPDTSRVYDAEELRIATKQKKQEHDQVS